jgi:hypothetical protein
VTRLLAATLVLTLALAACSQDSTTQQPAQDKPAVGQPFEVVAGGGDSVRTNDARKLKLSGSVQDLEVAPDGTAYLLITQAGESHVAQVGPDGAYTEITLQRTADVGNQIAVGPDGSVYVNLDIGGPKDAIYRLGPNGSRQQVIDYNSAASTTNGRPAKTIGTFGALTVDPQGRLVFAVKVSTKGTSGVMIRRVEANGTVRTLAGKPVRFTNFDAAVAATPAALHPPASGKALDWGTTAAMDISGLATQSDGTIVVETNGATASWQTGTILAVTPAGAMRQIAEGTSAGPAMAPTPFTRDGGIEVLGKIQTGISAADGLLAVATANQPGGRPEGGRYDWTGQYSDGQRAVLDGVSGFAIRLIRADSSVTTAAYGIRSALHDGYLYVVAENPVADRLVLGRLKLPV